MYHSCHCGSVVEPVGREFTKRRNGDGDGDIVGYWLNVRYESDLGDCSEV